MVCDSILSEDKNRKKVEWRSEWRERERKRVDENWHKRRSNE